MKKQWRDILDNDVTHFWVCANEECTEYKKPCGNGPEWYQQNGTPVCVECDEDMIYVKTSIMV